MGSARRARRRGHRVGLGLRCRPARGERRRLRLPVARGQGHRVRALALIMVGSAYSPTTCGTRATEHPGVPGVLRGGPALGEASQGRGGTLLRAAGAPAASTPRMMWRALNGFLSLYAPAGSASTDHREGRHGRPRSRTLLASIVIASLVLVTATSTVAQEAMQVTKLRTPKVALYDQPNGRPRCSTTGERQVRRARGRCSAGRPRAFCRWRSREASYWVRAYAVETNTAASASSADCGAVVASRQPKAGVTRGIGEECQK